MKKTTLVMVALLWTSLSFAGEERSRVETVEYDLVELLQSKGNCQYLGASAELGQSLLADVAETGMMVVENGIEAVACTAEVATKIAYNNIAVPVAKGAFTVLKTTGTATGKSIDWTIVTLVKLLTGKTVEATHNNDGPSEDETRG